MAQAKVILITGCSTGIGYETALLAAKKGWRVFATMRDLRKAGPLRAAASGLSLEFLTLDVDKPHFVKKAVAQVLKKAGRIDALVNNAGWGAFGALEEFTDAEIRAQFETNVFGLMRVTREVLPVMRAQGGGRILHIGSLAGRMTFGGIALYCATKHSVESLTEALRLETRPFNIQVAVVEPGTIRTPFKANRHKAGVFLQGRSTYQKVLEKVLYFGDHPSPSAPGPDRVAREVLKVLGSSRMKVRTPAGRDAFFFPLIRWGLPSFAYDLLMRMVYSKFLKGNRPTIPPDGRKGSPVAWVTGANSGFGLETAKALAKAGFRVYATYRQKARAGELFELALRDKVVPVAMDVTQDSSVRAVAETIRKKESRLDLLVNNAGSVVAGFLEDLSDGDLSRQFETNVFGALRVYRQAAPLMRSQGRGLILNIGSISGRVSFPGIGAYTASKHALRSLSEGMRMELAPFGVSVGEIAPGTFATKVVANATFGRRSKTKASPYNAFTKQVEELTQKEFRKAAPASQVAQMIVNYALKDRAPAVTMAGSDAKMMGFLKAHLPSGVFEWIFSRFFPWSRFP